MVLRGKWICNPATIKEADKDAKIYVGRSTTVHNLLFRAHTLCMNYVTKTFLFVCSSEVNNYCVLCTAKAKKSKKNIQQRTSSGFITISSY